MAGSLFERLTLGEAGANMDEDESIRRNIQRMFISRQGSVSTLPDYGLPDLNDLTKSRADLVQDACAALKACIWNYEPRLVDADVVHQPLSDELFAMGFHISAMKRDEQGRLRPWEWDFFPQDHRLRERG
jgi:type VI secretion system protein